MKKAVLLILTIFILGCSKTNNNLEVVSTFPEKTNKNSTLASESVITTQNIDEYLFRDDCVYIDTRNPNLFYSEGHIAGFINIPFYGYITDFKYNENTLFTMEKITDGNNIIQLGDVNSFSPIYAESASLIYDIIPRDKKILVISTAGVESYYFLNLLIQLGYDPAMLYNVGSFTNGIGSDIAYVDYSEAKYLVGKTYLYDTNINFALNIENLTKIEND